MVAQKTFGRRSATDVRPRVSTTSARFDAATPAALPMSSAQIPSFADIGRSRHTVDDTEFAAWKKQRACSPRLPWRQLSFVASLCFGVASLVLPDKVGDLVNWLLYALTAASFYAGWAARRRKRTV